MEFLGIMFHEELYKYPAIYFLQYSNKNKNDEKKAFLLYHHGL